MVTRCRERNGKKNVVSHSVDLAVKHEVKLFFDQFSPPAGKAEPSTCYGVFGLGFWNDQATSWAETSPIFFIQRVAHEMTKLYELRCKH